MNRRKFIKGFAPMVALPLIINVSEEEEEAVTITNTTPPPEILYGPYIVYFYERKQGEWIFSQNIKDSLSYKEFNNSSRSYSYVGYMRDGKVHFQSLDNAVDFILLDRKSKSHDDLEDLVYDVYYKNPKDKNSIEIKVCHYQFNLGHYCLNLNADNTI